MALTVIPTVVDGDDLTDDFTLGVKTAVGELQAMVTSGVATSATFSPAFTNTNGGTSPTLAGRNYRFGPLGVVEVYLQFGTGGSFAGSPTVTNLPYTFVGHPLGYCLYSDASTHNYTGSAYVSGTTITKFVHTGATNNGVIGATSPFTWTVSDEVMCLIVGFVA